MLKAPSTADLKVQLEQRYIQLLEQRIADLEALVKKSMAEKESESKDTDKDADGDKDDKNDEGDKDGDIDKKGKKKKGVNFASILNCNSTSPYRDHNRSTSLKECYLFSW